VTKRRITYALMALLLAACAAVGPEYVGAPRSTADSASTFPSSVSESEEVAAVTVAEQPPQAWWRQLEDPALDALMTKTVAVNYDLRIAAANVAAAQALLDQVATRRRPSVDVSAELEERRNSSAKLVIADPDTRFPATSSGEFNTSLSWEVDLFGRVRRSIESASAELGSLEAVRNGVMVSVLAQVARAYVDLRGAQLRLGVATRNVAVQKQTLELVELLLREGAATELDRARARTQLLTSLSTIPTLKVANRIAVNRLTTLIAQPPGALDSTVNAWQPLPQLVKLPEFVAVGSPTDLLRRRPDIVAAERALAAASARIGVATADLYPTITFGASAGVAGAPLSGFAAAGGPFFAVGPSLNWNIFDRSATYARISQADSNAAANVARFEATVTRALEEVDSAISGYSNERVRVRQLTAAVASSRHAADLARLRYREGAEDFLAVLDAERNLLGLEDLRARSEINVAQRLIDIHLALGGGWEALPAPAHQPYQ